jgi:TonB family protein
MKKTILLSIFSLLSLISFSQSDKQNSKVVTNTEPAYPAGDNVLYAYIMHNVVYSEEAKKKYIEGDVTLSFDVKTDSTVANIMVISGVGYGIDEEVKRLIQKLKFIPAMQNGVLMKMSTMYTFPVKAH